LNFGGGLASGNEVHKCAVIGASGSCECWSDNIAAFSGSHQVACQKARSNWAIILVKEAKDCNTLGLIEGAVGMACNDEVEKDANSF